MSILLQIKIMSILLKFKIQTNIMTYKLKNKPNKISHNSDNAQKISSKKFKVNKIFNQIQD